MRTLHDIPLYNADDETAHGLPLRSPRSRTHGGGRRRDPGHARVQQLAARRLQERDRLAVEATADIKRVFGGKPIAIIGASPGGFGTVLSQSAWLPVLRTLGATIWTGPRLAVSRAGTVFDEAAG